MPADLAVALLDAAVPQVDGDAGPARDEGPRWRDDGDGKRSMSFGSMDALRAAMRNGATVAGVKFGGK